MDHTISQVNLTCSKHFLLHRVLRTLIKGLSSSLTWTVAPTLRPFLL